MPSSHATLRLLGAYESRNVTFLDPARGWPMVWERARGVHVWDAEGRRYVDLTAAFGVAAAGHANPRVVAAGRRQMGRLVHAMGDVHPHRLKAELARALSGVTFGRWARAGLAPVGRGRTIFCNSGFEAVEAALKTARLMTGRPGVVAFEGAYHGTGYGALSATHRGHFRDPFRDQLGGFGYFAPYPAGDGGGGARLDEVERRVAALFAAHPVGGVLVEPVQGRGGIRIPHPDLLRMLRRRCDRHGALLITDEIYTGFGRTGAWFASEHSGVAPDVVCLGKALAGGFPLSACVGRADVMDRAWPRSTGEAIHTSTFLGHPVGCAMALAQLAEIRRARLVERARCLGAWLLTELSALRYPGGNCVARGVGLMAGIELRQRDGTPATAACMDVVTGLLRRGFIALPEGAEANVVSLTPPLTISRRDLARAVDALRELLGRPSAAGRSGLQDEAA